MGRPQDNPFENLGRAIKALRAEAGLSRGDLADRAGISYSYLAEIENGTKQPSTKTLVEVAQALGIEAHDLMERGTRLHQVPDVHDVEPQVARSYSRMEASPATPAWLDSDRESGQAEWRLMLGYWKRLGDEDRRMLLEMAERLAGE